MKTWFKVEGVVPDETDRVELVINMGVTTRISWTDNFGRTVTIETKLLDDGEEPDETHTKS